MPNLKLLLEVETNLPEQRLDQAKQLRQKFAATLITRD